MKFGFEEICALLHVTEESSCDFSSLVVHWSQLLTMLTGALGAYDAWYRHNFVGKGTWNNSLYYIEDNLQCTLFLLCSYIDCLWCCLTFLRATESRSCSPPPREDLIALERLEFLLKTIEPLWRDLRRPLDLYMLGNIQNILIPVSMSSGASVPGVHCLEFPCLSRHGYRF